MTPTKEEEEEEKERGGWGKGQGELTGPQAGGSTQSGDATRGRGGTCASCIREGEGQSPYDIQVRVGQGAVGSKRR